MRLLLLATLLAPIVSAAVAAIDAVADSDLAAMPGGGAPEVETELWDRSVHWSKRACSYNGCECTKLRPLKAGVYCGNCYWDKGTGPPIIVKKRVATHVYQCAKNGADCCDYGPADDCGVKPYDKARCGPY